MSVGVVVALAFSGLFVTNVRVVIAATRDASGKRPTIVFVVISFTTFLAKLALIALETSATFDPLGRFSGYAPCGRLQFKVVQEAFAHDPDGRDVGQQSHEVMRLETGRPSKFGIFMESKCISLHLIRCWQAVVLAGDGQGDFRSSLTSTHDDQV